MTSPKDWLKCIIEASGGCVEEDLFVTAPGVLLTQVPTITNDSIELFDRLNINTAKSYEAIAELNARITYLAFKEGEDPDYLERVTKHQHLSIFGSSHVTFLLAGLSVEAGMELIAHKEARVGRLTSSRTRAMSHTLYRIFGPDEEWQKDMIRRLAADRDYVKEATPTLDDVEVVNRMNYGCKAMALTYTMCLKDFHSLFIGRMNPNGNELEVRDLCQRMCVKLHNKFPLIIRTPSEYEAMSNGAKYALGE